MYRVFFLITYAVILHRKNTEKLGRTFAEWMEARSFESGWPHTCKAGPRLITRSTSRITANAINLTRVLIYFVPEFNLTFTRIVEQASRDSWNISNTSLTRLRIITSKASYWTRQAIQIRLIEDEIFVEFWRAVAERKDAREYLRRVSHAVIAVSLVWTIWTLNRAFYNIMKLC